MTLVLVERLPVVPTIAAIGDNRYCDSVLREPPSYLEYAPRGI